jgi:hypothetical protein
VNGVKLLTGEIRQVAVMVSKAELLNGFYQALALWRMVLPAMFIGCLCGNDLALCRIRAAPHGSTYSFALRQRSLSGYVFP